MTSSHWTIRVDDLDVLHIELLGHGGFGEVHKVGSTHVFLLKYYGIAAL